MRLGPVLALLLLSDCGARSDLAGLTDLVLPADAATPPVDAFERDVSNIHPGLEGGPDAQLLDGGEDADAALVDADASGPEPVDASMPTFEAGVCEEGQNTEYPPSECTSILDTWFASPYVPAVDITIDRMAVHSNGGQIAVLAASEGNPGTPLFVGNVSQGTDAVWRDVMVAPPLALQAGTLYFLAQIDDGLCSQTIGGPEDIEYDSPSVDGPWSISGTDNWTVRIYGTCP